MYKYEYKKVDFKNGFAKTLLDEHRVIIDSYAQRGWRFVGAIPTATIGYGSLKQVDLVFEKAE